MTLLEPTYGTDDFVPLPARWGLCSHSLGASHFSARHSGTGHDAYANCERSKLRRCGCCPIVFSHRCCQTATQEDGICDECRRWCPRRKARGIANRLATTWADG